MTAQTTSAASYQGKDMIILPDGATYHVGVKPGEVYPRVITVGSVARAKAIGQLLDVIEHDIFSARLFQTISGKYKGVGVTIIGIGMGAPMMDFMIREVSYVQPTPMAVIRLGTCGLWDPSLLPGTVVTAGKGCAISYQNYANWTDGVMNPNTEMPKDDYIVSKPLPVCEALNAQLAACLKANDVPTADGLNVAGDTFFACQGRKSGHFENGDALLIEKLAKDNGVTSMEMESFTLMLLAKMRTVAPLYAAAAHIGIINRVNDDIKENITIDRLHEIEMLSGRSALDALVSFDLGDENFPAAQ